MPHDVSILHSDALALEARLADRIWGQTPGGVDDTDWHLHQDSKRLIAKLREALADATRDVHA